MKYDHSKIEKKWQEVWHKEGIYEPNFESANKPFYNLMMFPYPSAEGLHVGNMYAFTGSDIYGRFKRMQGYDVFEPIGLDGFGIHSENYAIKIGQHPADQAKISEKNFYRQLGMIGNGFSWNEKLETYDPEYYKWTQWIFIQLFKKGLAYRKKALVNWCPSCMTVLADEQVIGGECERCGTKVIKKELEQWFFKITDYAERLLKGLGEIDPVRGRELSSALNSTTKQRPSASNGIDWSEKVKIAQRNWIGRSEGASLKFKVKNEKLGEIEVFTTRPDTVFGVTFMAISLELAQEWINSGWKAGEDVKNYVKSRENNIGNHIQKEKTGVATDLFAINPANDKEIPIWIADYVLSGYGTGAVMGVPAHDERDFEFAKKFKLPVSQAPLVSVEEAVKKSGGQLKTEYRLRDWLISRQRYWGAPIPMIYCEKCNWQPVPEENLPVKLPHIKNFRPTGTNESPLASDPKFYKIKCPKCAGEARRETDVSDTFLDSAWYYLGYLNLKKPFDKLRVTKWLPVDMYIGGAEHSVLHLLYVRFLAMVFHDLGLVHFEEPFSKFRAHGLLVSQGAKMSKSKGNVVTPDEYIKKYGADVLRMYLMFIGPFDQGGDFRDSGIRGITRFLDRVWKISQSDKRPAYRPGRQATSPSTMSSGPNGDKLNKKIHQTIKKVTEDVENLSYNTAISALMILLNEMGSAEVSKDNLGVFVKLLASFAPHMAEEVWREVLGHKESIHISEWPRYNSELIKESEVDIVVQINGKTRAVLKLPAGASQAEVEQAARSAENVSKHLAGRIRKVIFVKGKIINFVV